MSEGLKIPRTVRCFFHGLQPARGRRSGRYNPTGRAVEFHQGNRHNHPRRKRELYGMLIGDKQKVLFAAPPPALDA